MGRSHFGQTHCVDTRSISRSAFAQQVPSRKVSNAVVRRSTSTPERSPISIRTRMTIASGVSFTAASTESTSDWMIEYSCMVEVRLTFFEKRAQSLGERRSVGDAREMLELAVEVEIEAIDSRRLIHQLLGDPQRLGRPVGDGPGHGQHFGVERLVRQDARDEPVLLRAMRTETRVEQQQLERAAQADEPREE